jgi:tetratricopeptide (TPR) repeat protein
MIMLFRSCLILFFFLGALYGQSTQVIKDIMNRVVLIETLDQFDNRLGIGSGFIVGDNGEVATNYHVIEGASSAIVKYPGKNVNVPVSTIVHKDPKRDLVVIRVGFAPSPVSLGIDSLVAAGQKVLAFGNPRGLEGTVSNGIVSAVRRAGREFPIPFPDGTKVIQITAPISSGSSGGPIVNESGKVIGISTLMRRDGQNLNFAIPVSYLRRLLEGKSLNLPFTRSNLPKNIDSERTKIDNIKAQIEREALERSLRPADIEKLALEGGELYKRGKYHEAKANLSLAYGAFTRQGMKDQLLHVLQLRILARISIALQENDKAIEYSSKEAACAITDSDRGNAFNNIGLAYNNKGEYDKAIGYYEKALAISIKALGAEHPLVAATYNNIGLAYDNKDEYDKALFYYEKALAIELKALGANHPKVATIYQNIGTVYNAMDDVGKALSYYEKALAIDLKALGANHPKVATIYQNIGTVYDEKGDYDKAIAYLEKALAIQVKVLGAEHPLVGASYNNIGSAYIGYGNKLKAFTYFKNAKAIFLKKLGPQHASTKKVQAWIDLLK